MSFAVLQCEYNSKKIFTPFHILHVELHQALFYFSFANNWHMTSTYINSLYLS